MHGLQALVAKHAGSSDLEIQSRSCEYGRLFQFDSIRPQLLEPMPALDEATYMARFSAPAVVASGPALTVVRACARTPRRPLRSAHLVTLLPSAAVWCIWSFIKGQIWET